MVLPTSTALALANYPERAGTASALLGLLQYLVGGLAAPLVGLGGEDTAVPLGVVAASASLGAPWCSPRSSCHRSSPGGAPQNSATRPSRRPPPADLRLSPG
jgi:DHA1 family bicyclomycin/chloramphenicol resistance-like MFS transporter